MGYNIHRVTKSQTQLRQLSARAHTHTHTHTHTHAHILFMEINTQNPEGGTTDAQLRPVVDAP